jgi:glucokinase
VRPSRTLSARDENEGPLRPELAVGVDIGGTKVAIGVVSGTGKIIDRQVMATPAQDGAAIVEMICGTVQRLRARHGEVKALGVGAPGWVSWPDGKIHFSPYIAFRDLQLRQVLQDAVSLPVVVDNDANMAAWAESQFGAGIGVLNMLLLTLGTGIGGGIIINRQLYRGSNSLAAEVGHIIVDPDGELCGCGSRGCFETRASGTALGRDGREFAASHPTAYLAALAGGYDAVTGHTVTLAAKDGDEAAREILSRVGSWCGVGAASLVAILDPDLIVIAGGMAEGGDLLLGPMRASLQQNAFAREHRRLPPIVVSPLGSEAGVIGAGSLALHALRS